MLNPSTSSEPVEPKSPPAVAPKPKKLPSNIILKSHKSTAHHESTLGHPSAMDPQKVRMEALRKLGLLKSEESDSGPAHKSLQNRKSWAPASTPLSPTPPKSAPPSVPYTYSSPPVHTPALPVLSEPLPDIIPVPAAFSDSVENLPEISNKSPAFLLKKLSSGGGKSATLERSGLGLSSYMESLEQDKQTLGQLRNSRPRPASLGSNKDFSGTGGVSIKEADYEKPSPSSSLASDNSQKLPRSQGISVLICPRAQSDESRREALKKLGLLRD
ncbi:hypothetical protein WMY93_004235 [Mugilogobius chulae]|uniref:Specifically androgen-regulated gene protein n=1 Tax=Mugilogobius chulae TaxID=88201 RepID=A0AAW0PNH4_9GOBI